MTSMRIGRRIAEAAKYIVELAVRRVTFVRVPPPYTFGDQRNALDVLLAQEPRPRLNWRYTEADGRYAAPGIPEVLPARCQTIAERERDLILDGHGRR